MLRSHLAFKSAETSKTCRTPAPDAWSCPPLNVIKLFELILPGLSDCSNNRINSELGSGLFKRPLLHFGHGDLHNATALLLSRDSSTLYVGAQNAILSLDVNQIRLCFKSFILFKATEESTGVRVGKEVMWRFYSVSVVLQNECPNFIHVLQPLNSTHLYTCGSYAYSPQEAYIVGSYMLSASIKSVNQMRKIL
uniref:Sema domain-containing protein n=1 Tax=Neolamprologus brichardi TaxID=32507 RepID=A0A3Q4GI69_NEOBR